MSSRRIQRATIIVTFVYIISVIIVAFIGSYIAAHGNKVAYNRVPTQQYETVSFKTQEKDNLTLNGWYFPADSSTKYAVIAHGWGGHRARLLDLAEYLQRGGVNVLTFDMRGGTGKNSYGQKESQDIAGAVAWLQETKHANPQDITVIGASMGGAASIIYASEQKIGKLVLISSVVDLKELRYKILKDWHLLWPQVYAAVSALFERALYNIHPISPKDVFVNVEEPTLMLHGDADELASYAAAQKLTRYPNVQFITIPGGTHKFLDLDKGQGYPYDAKILEFINR